jgi:DNA polymerase-1
MKKLVLIDGNSMIFKAYYATAYTGNLMIGPDGKATNAVQAMANMMFKVLKERKPDHILVAFDAGKQTVRHANMPTYKDGRSKTPTELKEQFPLVKEMLEGMGIPHYELEMYEADDIIGTLAKRGELQGYNVEVFTSDKDMLQLIDKQTTVYLTHKGISQLEAMDIAALDAK